MKKHASCGRNLAPRALSWGHWSVCWPALVGCPDCLLLCGVRWGLCWGCVCGVFCMNMQNMWCLLHYHAHTLINSVTCLSYSFYVLLWFQTISIHTYVPCTCCWCCCCLCVFFFSPFVFLQLFWMILRLVSLQRP